MEKTTKVLFIILFLIFSVAMGGCTSAQKTDSTPVTKEVPNITKKMYLKGGRIIECDMVWEGIASQILCKKSADIVAYSAGDVDLIRTFGKSTGTEIGQRYEERAKSREYRGVSGGIVSPEQERWMKKQRLERERKKAAYLKEQKEAVKAGCYQHCIFLGGSASFCADECTPSTYVDVDVPDTIFIYEYE